MQQTVSSGPPWSILHTISRHAAHFGAQGLAVGSTERPWEGLGQVLHASAAGAQVTTGPRLWPIVMGSVNPWWLSDGEDRHMTGPEGGRRGQHQEDLFYLFWKGHRSLYTNRRSKWSDLSITWNLLIHTRCNWPRRREKNIIRGCSSSNRVGTSVSLARKDSGFFIVTLLTKTFSFLNKVVDLEMSFNMKWICNILTGRREKATYSSVLLQEELVLWILTNKCFIIRALIKKFPSFQSWEKVVRGKWKIHP